MKQRTFLAVIFMAAFLFLAAGISQLAVTDPVESNYALTALEMVRSGDWLSPQIYGTYWYDKPIFLYWLLSLSYSLLGTPACRPSSSAQLHAPWRPGSPCARQDAA